jgi:glyoxylase-like metal-dependent hydrolase (beta-lactamase superfamily II)
LAVAAALFCIHSGSAGAQAPADPAGAPAPRAQSSAAPAPAVQAGAAPAAQGPIAIYPVRGNVYMLVAAQGNSTVQSGPDGILVVDTMGQDLGEPLLATLRTMSAKPIRYVINTGIEASSTGGNATIAVAGSTIAGGNVNMAIEGAQVGATVVAHENLLTRISKLEPAPPFEAWPTATFFAPTKNIFFNGEPVQVIHQPNVRTDGDSIVFFRRSDVLSTGGVFDPTRYPHFDVASGGSLQGVIDALNRIIDIAIPADRNEGGTLIVPGRGRLRDESEVVEYRDMIVIVSSSIREMVREGRTLQQIKDAKPTLGFDPIYAVEPGPWTPDQFVEAVYREIRARRR